jgi:hypothetical protein
MTELTTSFIVAPAPCGPRCRTRLAKVPSTGLARSTAAASPPTRAVSAPCSTSATLPETGLSSRCAPRPATADANSRTVAG